MLFLDSEVDSLKSAVKSHSVARIGAEREVLHFQTKAKYLESASRRIGKRCLFVRLCVRCFCQEKNKNPSMSG